jgi:hypothetical protein
VPNFERHHLKSVRKVPTGRRYTDSVAVALACQIHDCFAHRPGRNPFLTDPLEASGDLSRLGVTALFGAEPQAIRAQVQTQARIKSAPTASNLPEKRCRLLASHLLASGDR